MTQNQTKVEEWEKKIVGKNVHSVYLHCLKCGMFGTPFPLEKECGNCGHKTREDLITYYDSDTISQILTQKDQEYKSKLEEVFEEIDKIFDKYRPTANNFEIADAWLRISSLRQKHLNSKLDVKGRK